MSVRCGFSQNSRQIRPTVDLDNPLSAAVDARDQCVASFGVRSKVATIVADAPRSTGTRLIQQAVQPPIHETSPPLAHHRRCHP